MSLPSLNYEKLPASVGDVSNQSTSSTFLAKEATERTPSDNGDESVSTSMVRDLTEYLVYPVSVIKSFISKELAITEEAMNNQSAYIYTAARKLSQFDELSKKPVSQSFSANTDTNQAALQLSARQASLSLQKAQRCDPLLSNVYRTMEDEFKCAPGTGKAANKRLNQYWKNGGLDKTL